MTTAEKILLRLDEIGVSLAVSGDHLIAKPSELVGPEMVAYLRSHKQEVIAELRFREDPVKHPRTPEPLEASELELAEADDRGLVATWAHEQGFVAVHDPTTGEWHDIPMKEAPSWGQNEARYRKRLYKSGNRRAYSLTSRQIEQLRAEESGEEVVVEEHMPGVTPRGIVYEDYLEQDD